MMHSYSKYLTLFFVFILFQPQIHSQDEIKIKYINSEWLIKNCTYEDNLFKKDILEFGIYNGKPQDSTIRDNTLIISRLILGNRNGVKFFRGKKKFGFCFWKKNESTPMRRDCFINVGGNWRVKRKKGKVILIFKYGKYHDINDVNSGFNEGKVKYEVLKLNEKKMELLLINHEIKN